MSQTVREIAARIANAEPGVYEASYVALAAHVLASPTEALGDEKLRDNLATLRNGLSRDWANAADAVEAEIRRLQAVLNTNIGVREAAETERNQRNFHHLLEEKTNGIG